MAKKRTFQVKSGQRFGRLEVVDPEVRISQQPGRPGGWRAALCQCDCGSQKAVRLNHLISGFVQSCGCLRMDNRLTHGLHAHPLYGTWANMMARCHNPHNKDYPRWGGRGITVYPEWHDIVNFTAWVESNLGPRPIGCTLDRYPDNNGNYEPGNIRWANPFQQRMNTDEHPPQVKRRTRENLITAARLLRREGFTQQGIAEIIGVNQSTVSQYLRG